MANGVHHGGGGGNDGAPIIPLLRHSRQQRPNSQRPRSSRTRSRSAAKWWPCSHRVTRTTALPGRSMQFVRDTIGGLASTNAVPLPPREPELPAAAAAAPATLLVIQADDYDWKAIFAGARSGLAVYSTGIVVMH
jgi:hypothetical protein